MIITHVETYAVRIPLRPERRMISSLGQHTVSDYVLGQDGAEDFLTAYVGALSYVLDGYVRENKRYATVAVGCTGGRHRSVAMSEALARRLTEVGVHASAVHRDLGRE